MSNASKMNITQGWLSASKRCLSPNADQRPANKDISLLVIHNISLPPEQFGGPYIGQLFTNCLDPEADPYFASISDLRVSSHLLIDRRGQITQFVPFCQRAWHAGVSEFQGRDRCNDFSIGIEMEGADHILYTDRQYEVLVAVTQVILDEFPLISLDRIVAHSQIAAGRKTDPGPAFDWQRYRQALL